MEDSILEPSINIDDQTSSKNDQTQTPMSRAFTSDSKPALVTQLEHVVLKLNRKGMMLLQKKKHQDAL